MLESPLSLLIIAIKPSTTVSSGRELRRKSRRVDAACDAGRAVRAYRVHVMHVRCGYMVGSSSIRGKVGVGMWVDLGIWAYRPEMRYRFFDYRYTANNLTNLIIHQHDNKLGRSSLFLLERWSKRGVCTVNCRIERSRDEQECQEHGSGFPAACDWKQIV